MASTINSTGTSSGIVSTADASGVLNLQGGGNTGISISATGVPTITTPTISGILTGVGSNSLSSILGTNVTGITANWTNIVNTGSIGASGQKWLLVSVAQIANANTANGSSGMRLYDATLGQITINYVHCAAANFNSQIICAAVVTLTAAANVYLQGYDFSGTNGLYAYATSTYITATRLA